MLPIFCVMRSGNLPLLIVLISIGGHAMQPSLPVMFQSNMGQAEAGVAFVAQAPGYMLKFDSRGMTAVSRETSVRMELQGASLAVRLSGDHPQEGKANYLVGDLDRWITEVPLFGGARYEGVYPGINLVFQSDGFGWPSGAWTQIPGRFVLRGPHDAGFQMEKYDTNAPTVIDPVVSYASYIGGSAADQA